MNWQALTQPAELDMLNQASFQRPQLIFKHSTRCGTSAMIKGRLLNADLEFPVYYLDLIQYRAVSNAIAERYHVVHESPQVLLIHKGECILEASHIEITASLIREGLT